MGIEGWTDDLETCYKGKKYINAIYEVIGEIEDEPPSSDEGYNWEIDFVKRCGFSDECNR